MIVESSTTINAPIEVVWEVFTDVAAWPTWTTTVRSVAIVDDGPLKLGTRVRIAQPRLPTMVWTVNEFADGACWTWETQRAGAHTIAVHRLVAMNAGCTQVTQSIEQRGPLGVLVGWLYSPLTKRYLDTEGRGLALAAEQAAHQGDGDSPRGVR